MAAADGARTEIDKNAAKGSSEAFCVSQRALWFSS